jgi:hypothetical protein
MGGGAGGGVPWAGPSRLGSIDNRLIGTLPLIGSINRLIGTLGSGRGGVVFDRYVLFA